MGIYTNIIDALFFRHFREGDTIVTFERHEIPEVAEELGISLPKNLGDVIYSFKFRTELPERIKALAPEGYDWMIRSVGQSVYQFVLTTRTNIVPTELLTKTKIPDATPGLIRKYAIDDEQGLLATLRYNRLIDIFLGLTCYSLQSHLRTFVPGIGQVETDEIYVGLDKRGVHYVVPVQAKGGADRIGVPQIEQDFALCAYRFANLVARPVAAQSMDDNLIALFEFEETEEGVGIVAEKHYLLVAPDDLSEEELTKYRERLAD